MLSFRMIIVACLVGLSVSMSLPDSSTQQASRPMQKKSFSSIGCLGNFDKDKYARLDGICDECYQIYRDQEINRTCR